MRTVIIVLLFACMISVAVALATLINHDNYDAVMNKDVTWYETFYVNRYGRTVPVYMSYQVISGVTYEVITDENNRLISMTRRSDKPTVFELKERAKQ